MTNVFRPVSKSAIARSIVVSSNVGGHVKAGDVKAVCSSNVSKQNACNVSSVEQAYYTIHLIEIN